MEDEFWQDMANATGGTVLPCDGKNKVFRPIRNPDLAPPRRFEPTIKQPGDIII